MFYLTTYSSPLGKITLARTGDQLVGLWLEGQKYHGGGLAGKITEGNEGRAPIFDLTKKWLDRYFQGKRPDPAELSLAPTGGGFRQRVWSILGQIPYGDVTTYRSIAEKMVGGGNSPARHCRAVGGAVGHNPISIIIPCHRVVGSKGSLTGYAGGLAAKIKLLELEGIDLANLSLPKEAALG